MIRKWWLAAACGAALCGNAQPRADEIINSRQVAEILGRLSADDMAGRYTFGPQIQIAANYLAGTFEQAGLQKLAGTNSYLQTFSMVKAKALTASTIRIGTEQVLPEKTICQTGEKALTIMPGGNFETISIKQGDNAMASFRGIRSKKGNLLVLMHPTHEPFFNRIKQNAGARMQGESHVIYILTEQPEATDYAVNLSLDVEEIKLSNVVGVIPGKSRPEEVVVFSGHYDHIGIGKPNDKGDSIYNGANDDASGTTAVVLLARYFAALGPQERTLVFAAFTGEEVGGFGSQYFSKQLNPAKVVAMFNIEMIGTDSKWGTNSAFITGFEKTDMGTILQKNLEGSPFKFYPDPYPEQQLFYRSDNATLARLGVPAHTISTSKMDVEPHYHKPSDEISTLDVNNMAEIIKAIAISSQGIISGKATPTRVDASQLR
ncbi:MAG: M28 family peptidase [Chitinophagaceae bacterium]|nr:M28 family peptidase [Chitinophagaceae bacterium]